MKKLSLNHEKALESIFSEAYGPHPKQKKFTARKTTNRTERNLIEASLLQFHFRPLAVIFIILAIPLPAYCAVVPPADFLREFPCEIYADVQNIEGIGTVVVLSPKSSESVRLFKEMAEAPSVAVVLSFPIIMRGEKKALVIFAPPASLVVAFEEGKFKLFKKGKRLEPNFEKATKTLERWLSLRWGNPRNRIYLAKAILHFDGRSKLAKMIVSPAVDRKSARRFYEEALRLYRIYCFSGRGDLRRILSLLEDALRLDPTNDKIKALKEEVSARLRGE